MTRFTTTDAKTARIENSWFRPTRRDAHWLASIADEVSLTASPSRSTDAFVYVSLHDSDRTAPGSALAIPANAYALAAARIPSLALADAARVVLAA